jgi:hypothetical protein
VRPGRPDALAGTGQPKCASEIRPKPLQYFGGLDNPQRIVYRIEPLQVRYMQEWSLEYDEVV